MYRSDMLMINRDLLSATNYLIFRHSFIRFELQLYKVRKYHDSIALLHIMDSFIVHMLRVIYLHALIIPDDNYLGRCLLGMIKP